MPEVQAPGPERAPTVAEAINVVRAQQGNLSFALKHLDDAVKAAESEEYVEELKGFNVGIRGYKRPEGSKALQYGWKLGADERASIQEIAAIRKHCTSVGVAFQEGDSPAGLASRLAEEIAKLKAGVTELTKALERSNADTAADYAHGFMAGYRQRGAPADTAWTESYRHGYASGRELDDFVLGVLRENADLKAWRDGRSATLLDLAQSHSNIRKAIALLLGCQPENGERTDKMVERFLACTKAYDRERQATIDTLHFRLASKGQERG